MSSRTERLNTLVTTVGDLIQQESLVGDACELVPEIEAPGDPGPEVVDCLKEARIDYLIAAFICGGTQPCCDEAAADYQQAAQECLGGGIGV